MRKLFFLAILSLCFIQASYSQEWIKFTSVEGHFSVLFPSEPRTQSDTSTTYPTYITKLFLSKDKADLFAVGWVDYESSYIFDDQKELEANRDNFLKGINGTLVSTKNIEFKGYKGIEFSAKSDSYIWTSKVFIVGRRPYQLLTGGSKGTASENENKFFDSFSISK